MRKLLILSALVTLVLATAWKLWSATPGVTATAPPLADGFRFQWPAGETYRYELAWQAEQTTRMDVAGEARDMRGALAIDADLVLKSYGDVDGVTWLGLTFEKVDRASLTVAEQDALSPDALLGKEALVAMGPDGRVAELRFDPEDDSAFPHIVQGLVAELEVVAPPAGASTWQPTQEGPRGRAVMAYRLTGHAPLAFERHALRYERLTAMMDRSPADLAVDARGDVTVDRGALAGLDTRERLAVDGLTSDVTVRARLVSRTSDVGREPLASVLARPWASREPGTAQGSAAMRRRLLENRAAGLTVDDVISDLFMFARGGMMPDHQRWLWRATAALLLEPARAGELLAVFEDPSVGGEGRALVLDLLASAGHPEAQAAMRAALDSAAAADDRGRGRLVQRLGFVAEPTEETLSYLSARARASDDTGRAHLMALGAAVGSSEGDARFAQLAGEVERAGTPADRAVALRALGNAGGERVIEHATRHASDPDRDVRHGAAMALRRVDTPRATETLLALLSDPELEVQRAALAALAARDLDAGALGRIVALAQAGTLGRAHDGQLLDIAADHGVRALAQVVLGRNGDDAEMRARARAILEAQG